MVFIESGPHLQVPFPFRNDQTGDSPIGFTCIPNTSVLAVLTGKSVLLYDQSTFLPIGSHERSQDSIKLHGYNIDVKTKYIDISTIGSNFRQVNLFILTDASFLIIYQIWISDEAAIYQVHDSSDDRLIQSAEPFLTKKFKLSLTSLLKSAGEMIASSQSSLPNLVNPEHINNTFLMDNQFSSDVLLVKRCSIFKMLKLDFENLDFWFMTHSHDILVFNRDLDEHANFQVVNVKTFKSRIFGLTDCAWYTGPSNIKFMTYNKFRDYFVFVNGINEVWAFDYKNDTGQKVHVLDDSIDVTDFTFNPLNDLVIVMTSSTPKIFSLEYKPEGMVHLMDIDTFKGKSMCMWAPFGDFFALVDLSTGYWSLYSKFGNPQFSSADLELDFLRASCVYFSPNSMYLYIINHDKSELYSIKLRRQLTDGICFSIDYINVINGKSFMAFPILSNFKKMIERDSSQICISRNDYDQIAISQGNNISISTPIVSNSATHPLWFMFNNHSGNPLNIRRHFWFNDYLVIVNRSFEDNASDLKSVSFDEIRIINAKKSKHGHGGEVFAFDEESIIWTHNFHKTKFIDVQYVKNNHEKGNLLIVTEDMRLIILEISTAKGNQDIGNIKNYNIFIEVFKVIHMESMNSVFSTAKIIQTTMISKRHFVFLLSTGQVYIMRNTTTVEQKSNFNLIPLGDHVERFDLFDASGIEFLYFRSASGDLRVYELLTLLETNAEPIIIPFDQKLQVLNISNSFEVVYLESKVSEEGFITQKTSRELVLNKFIEHYLVHDESKINQLKNQKFYDYALELLLFTYGNEDKDEMLRKLLHVIGDNKDILIRCFRKIELTNWEKYFAVLNTNLTALMTELIDSGNVEQCYHFLIIYLNSKTEEDDEKGTLTAKDHELVTKIINMLAESHKWEWCFELCRFIKILEPHGDFLRKIQESLTI